MQTFVLVFLALFFILKNQNYQHRRICPVYRLRIPVGVTLLVKPTVTSIPQSGDVDCSHTGGTEDNLLSLHPTSYALVVSHAHNIHSVLSVLVHCFLHLVCVVLDFFFLPWM